MRGALAALGFAACLAPMGAAAQEAGPADPWEDFNRNMYSIHDDVDQGVFEPIARGYRAVTPSPVRSGVRNFLRNLQAPVILANDVLQGEVGRAGTTIARFGLNSTIGLLGVFDPATSMGLERHDEDFGQTLAVWGVDSGPYVFVPLIGPTTVRDGAGALIDRVFDPFSWAEGDDVDTFRVTRTVLTAVSARESVIETIDDIRRDSLDPYVTIRTGYGLLRESAIQNGRSDVQDLPDFGDSMEPSPEGGDAAPGEFTQHSSTNEAHAAAPTLDAKADTPTSSDKAGDKL